MAHRGVGAVVTIVVVALVAAACGGGDDDGQLVELDPRCESLCADNEAECSDEVAACEPVCQVRVTGMSALCATCLIEGASHGVCQPGAPCCPGPQFPNSVLDCAASCTESAGVNPSPHPICADLCAHDDVACGADVTQCNQECAARIQGVSGLCALCLLEGAGNGPCGGSGPCCPDPTFPTATNTCADVCTTS